MFEVIYEEMETLYVHKWDFKFIDLNFIDEDKKESLLRVPYIIKPKYEGKDIVISIFIDIRLNERMKAEWEDGVLDEYKIIVKKADMEEDIPIFDGNDELTYFNYQSIFLMKKAENVELVSELINKLIVVENDTVREYSYKTNAKLIDLDDLDKDIQDQLYEMRMNFYATNLIIRNLLLLISDGDEEEAEENWEEIKENVMKQIRIEEGNGTDGLFDF